MPEGCLVDALALRGDEGRGTLRKVMGSREQALIRESPNGETHFRRSAISERGSEAILVADHCLPITDYCSLDPTTRPSPLATVF